MSYPDLPAVPEVPSHRLDLLTSRQILDQARAALHAARLALNELENGAPTEGQLARIRQVVIECRRSTFVLQKLSSRVEGFDDWYQERQAALRSDPLMRYFHTLRTEIEKEGLPGIMAELYDRRSGEAIGDVACGEDRHGIWVSGALRADAEVPTGIVDDASKTLGLRSFRLPDPPLEHCGESLTDLRFSTLAGLVIKFLWTEVLQPADERFGGDADALG